MTYHTYATTLHFGIDGDPCVTEHNATVHYYRHAAIDGGRDEPSAPAFCEVIKIVVARRYSHNDVNLPGWIVVGLEDSLQPALMQEWADDRAAAVERRDDARADDRIMEGGL